MGDLLGHAVRFGDVQDVMAAAEGIETILSLRQALPTMPMISDSPDGAVRRKANRPSGRLDMEYSELPLRVLRRSTAALALVDRMRNKLQNYCCASVLKNTE